MNRIKYIFFALYSLVALSGCKTEKVATKSSEAKLSEKDEMAFSEVFFNASRAKILGNYSESMQLFQRALEIDSSNATVKYEIARLYADNGNFVSAIQYAQKAWNNDVENEWYAKFLAQLYAETGKLAASEKVYRKLLETHSEDLSLYFDLGNLLSAQGKYKDALEMYDELEERTGVSEEVSMQRQMIYIDQGNYDKALEEVNKLIANNPEEVRLYGMKAEIYQQQGRKQEALTLYEDMLNLEPNNGLVLLSLYELYLEEGKTEKANEFLEEAFISPDLGIDVKVNILLNYLSAPNFKERSEDISSLAEKLEIAHPNEAKTFAVQGDIYYNLNKPELAREKFRKAIDLDPNRPPIWQQIVTIDSQLNDFDAMEKESAEALELFPQLPIFYLFNGIALLQQKQIDEAISMLESGKNLVIDNNPMLAQFNASLGDAYHEKGNAEKSDNAYDLALKYDPSNVVVLNNYAYYLSLRGQDLEKAEAMAKKANNLSPDVASFQDTYGWVLYKRQNFQNALFWIEQSLKNGAENDPVVQEHYGDVLIALGRAEEAIAAWNKAIANGGDEAMISAKIEKHLKP